MGNINSTPPDYSRYTIEDLEDVLANIDQAQYPDRHLEAKAMLYNELKKQRIELNNHDDHASSPVSKPKWSELLLITRIVTGASLVMIFSLLPTMFYKFMTTKSWTENTLWVIWILTLTLVTMWFVCLKEDSKYMQRLEKDWRGKLAIVAIPFLFMITSSPFIDKSLPLFLHMVSKQQQVQYEMNYKKRKGIKHCRQRVEIIETDELEEGDLCMSERQRNSLPEKGKITVLGTRSRFGMVIDGFILP